MKLLEPDEGRYAQIPREMPRNRGVAGADTAGRAVPRQGLRCFYWLVKLAYIALGPTPAAARCVPALAVQLTVLAV